MRRPSRLLAIEAGSTTSALPREAPRTAFVMPFARTRNLSDCPDSFTLFTFISCLGVRHRSCGDRQGPFGAAACQAGGGTRCTAKERRCAPVNRMIPAKRLTGESGRRADMDCRPHFLCLSRRRARRRERYFLVRSSGLRWVSLADFAGVVPRPRRASAALICAFAPFPART